MDGTQAHLVPVGGRKWWEEGLNLQGLPEMPRGLAEKQPGDQPTALFHK